MKKIIAIALAALAVLSMIACGGGKTAEPAQPAQQAAAAVTYTWEFGKKNDAVNDIKNTPAAQQGTVTELEYETPAYAVNDLLGLNETLTKKATVYLPYGYDESKQYNILYLLHGTKGESDGPMEEFWLVQWGDTTRNVLDHMIESGLCEPLIVVCPNYYSYVDGHDLGDEQAKALSEKLGDSIIFAAESEDGGELDNPQNIWPCYFGQELRNNIIPAAEAKFSTYAKGDVSEANLIATRDHRAFAGLSRGSMTVARAGLTENVDIISYFGNYSGIWQQFDAFKTAITGKFNDYKVNFWYNGNGKADFAKQNHEDYLEKVKAELSDKFVDGENYAYVCLRDGGHMYFSWLVDLYNSLLVFFH